MCQVSVLRMQNFAYCTTCLGGFSTLHWSASDAEYLRYWTWNGRIPVGTARAFGCLSPPNRFFPAVFVWDAAPNCGVTSLRVAPRSVLYSTRRYMCRLNSAQRRTIDFAVRFGLGVKYRSRLLRNLAIYRVRCRRKIALVEFSQHLLWNSERVFAPFFSGPKPADSVRCWGSKGTPSGDGEIVQQPDAYHCLLNVGPIQRISGLMWSRRAIFSHIFALATCRHA